MQEEIIPKGKNVTQWSPDTCKCVLHYEVEYGTDGVDNVHHPIEKYLDVENKVRKTIHCVLHAVHKTNLKAHHEAVILHNRDPKNQENKHFSYDEHVKRGLPIDHLHVSS